MDFGKWSQAGVPHKGWICTGVEDCEERELICEMCERQKVRFVHYMEHPDYDKRVACGCDCAAKMEEDHVGAEVRDKRMRNAASTRKRFPELKAWRISKKGNPYLKRDGFHITIFPKANALQFVVSYPLLEKEYFSKRYYSTKRDAQLAAFDALGFLKSKWMGIE